MWELDYEESWAPKNWCFWTVVLEKTLESPLDCKEIQTVHPKGDQSWVFIGRIDAKAKAPIFWLPHAKSWLIGKDSDAGRDWGQEEKGTTEDEMAGWHHGLDGREFEWTPGVGDGQGGLACVIHGVAKSQTRLSDWTELNWTHVRLVQFSVVFVLSPNLICLSLVIPIDVINRLNRAGSKIGFSTQSHLFFNFLNFNWRLITLQYCSGFAIHLTWISHGCTCVPHPRPPSLPIPSLWVVPVHWLCKPRLLRWTWTGDLFHKW